MRVSGLKRSMPCVDLSSMVPTSSPFYSSSDDDASSCISSSSSGNSSLMSLLGEFSLEDEEISTVRSKRQRLLPATVALEESLATRVTIEQMEYMNIVLSDHTFASDWDTIIEAEANEPTTNNESAVPQMQMLKSTYQPIACKQSSHHNDSYTKKLHAVSTSFSRMTATA